MLNCVFGFTPKYEDRKEKNKKAEKILTMEGKA